MQAEGPGWRLAVDPARPGYQALIGGEGWAIEISLDELSQLKSLCGRLQEQHLAISDQLSIPVRFVGIGEKMEDLQDFEMIEFIDSLLPANWEDGAQAAQH